jgi:hypothetical protein
MTQLSEMNVVRHKTIYGRTDGLQRNFISRKFRKQYQYGPENKVTFTSVVKQSLLERIMPEVLLRVHLESL